MKKLRCLIGVHRWEYISHNKNKRQCAYCEKKMHFISLEQFWGRNWGFWITTTRTK